MSHDRCLACNGTDLRVVFDNRENHHNEHPRPISANQVGSSRLNAGSMRVVGCSHCRLAWQDPMPSASLLSCAYANMKDEQYVAESSGRRRSLRRCLRLLSRYAGGTPGRLLDVG